MLVRFPLLVGALALVGVSPAFAQEEDTGNRPLRGIGIEESLADESTLAAILEGSGLGRPSFPLFVMLRVPRAQVEIAPGSYAVDALDERLDALRQLGAQVVVALDGLPLTIDESESWAQYLLAIVRQTRGRATGFLLAETAADELLSDPELYSYILRLSAVQIRSEEPDALVIEELTGANAALIESLYEQDIQPYVDAIAVSRANSQTAASFADTLASVRALMRRQDPTSDLLVTAMPLPPSPAEAASRVVRSISRHLLAGATLTNYSGSQEALEAALSTAAKIPELFSNRLIPLDPEQARLAVEPEGPPDVRVESVLLYDTSSGSTYLSYYRGPSSPSAAARVAISVAIPSAQAPVIHDPVAGEQITASSFERDESTITTRLVAPLMEQPLVLEFRSRAVSVDVSAVSDPDVARIIALHQQAQAIQDNVLASYIANATIEVHFQLGSGVPGGVDVVTENRFYLQDGVAEWEELSFSLNGTRWGPNRPPFPLLQPEKVLSLPLVLQLNNDYEYRLVGREMLGDHSCWIVSFEPFDSSRSLYRGSVWIDENSFVKRKAQVVQTQLSSPVASNEEIQVFEEAGEVDGVTLLLASSIRSQLLFLIAGRNVLVEKEITVTSFELNPADFVERRGAALSSDRIMLRETDEGLRYLVKRGDERVVSDELTRSATALAMGVTVDPALDYPLPIFGVNHLDFDFLGRDLQFAVLFGGVLALGNVQKTSFLGTPFDVSFDFFAIAVKGTDKIFVGGEEIPGARLRTLPFATGINLGWQFTDFQKVTGSYHLGYDHFEVAESTEEQFRLPSSTITNSASLVYEYQRGGYSLIVNGSYAKRASWEPWGVAFDPNTQSYAKYGLSFSKSFFLSPFQKFQLGTAYFDGNDLDRFTMYQTGLFSSTQVRGVPAGGVRFDKLGVIRAAYAFNVFDQIGFDIYLDQVFGRDPINSTTIEPITGIGMGVDLRGPWQTLLTANIAKSFLPESYSGAGSVTADILFLKPF